MNRLAKSSIILGLALVLALPVPAMATHMSQYRYTPTAHDDLGRSDEPNFAGVTNILGPSVGDRDVDAQGTGTAQNYPVGVASPGLTKVVAPGCTDNAGRQPSGLCGLWTVGVGNTNTGTIVPRHTSVAGVPVGVQGMTGGRAPGRFTPTQGSTVRFLDGRIDGQAAVAGGTGGSIYFDYNHALFADNPAAGTLAGQGIGPTILPGGSALWAWYGDWTDKNGNGVIDEYEGKDPTGTPATCGSDGCVDSTNEFVWVGNCLMFQGKAPPLNQQYCKFDPGTTMPVWIFPGNHHSICYGLVVAQTCGSTNPQSYADLPGRQVICFVDIFTAHSTPFVCPGEIGAMEDFDADPSAGQGDALLDKMDQVIPDQIFDDRSGDSGIGTRQYGGGWQTEFYDNGIITTTTMVTIVTHQSAADKGTSNWFDLTKASFSDVDRYTSWNPIVNNLVNNPTGVKATARGEWVFARDSSDTIAKTQDSLLNERLLVDACDTTWLHVCPLGPVDNVVPPGTVPDPTHGVTSGNAPAQREPNTPLDVEPGARYHAFAAGTTPGLQPGQEAVLGYLNDYSGYAQDYHAWVDINAAHSTLYNMAWTVGGPGNCITCATGGSLGEPDVLGQGALTPAGDLNRVLQPGTYLFGGPMAAWKDRVQHHHEEVLNPTNPTGPHVIFDYNVGPDTWAGDLVNSTGTFRDRGYGPESCNLRGVTATREWTYCHQGAGDSFNTNFATGGEAVGIEKAGSQYQLYVTPNSLTPGPNDCWNVPVIVWRHLDTWEVGDLSAVQSYQGKCGADAVIALDMGQSGCCASTDEFILPEGNHGVTVYTSLSGSVTFQPPTVNGITPPLVTEFVRDVDVYAPYGSAIPV